MIFPRPVGTEKLGFFRLLPTDISSLRDARTHLKNKEHEKPQINNQPVSSQDDVERILAENDGGGVLLEGKYKGEGRMTYFGFGL